jgi:hypothetical protein
LDALTITAISVFREVRNFPSGLRRLGMAKINLGRVILGGLLAGLVINIGEFVLNMVILEKPWEEALKALNLHPFSSSAVTYLVLLAFALGILAVWVYSAIRPRFGAGPMTAICAGLIVWALASLYPTGGALPMHLFPRRLLFYTTLWELFELPIATLVGAWIYRE